MKKPILLAAVVLPALLTLQGCVPLVIGGVVAGGGAVAFDRRTSGAQVEDEAIELKAGNRVRELATLGRVSVTSYNRTMLVTGEVPTENDRGKVEDALRRTENVRAVVNELAVAPNSSLSQRSNDSLVSAKVKATFVDAKDVHANAIKVVTERGTVYLMGRVTEYEAKRASDIARTVAGVQKVVRVFEVVSEDELAGVAKPAPK